MKVELRIWQWAVCSVTAALMLGGVLSCKHDAPNPVTTTTDNNFPPEIAKIFVNRCATAGCHNAASYINAGGLLLDSWDHLFDGGNNGAVVIPYDPANSSLLYFINSYPDLGTVATPSMPSGQAPLTRDEYITVRDWIAKGAPGKNGNIPFASNEATRQKIYITQQGCDLVGVIDAERKVVMRYIHAGTGPIIETPDYIKLSQDGQYAYVCFWNASLVQKIDTRKDSIIATTPLADAYWKTAALSPDGNTLLISTWQSQRVVAINTATMQVSQTYTGSFEYPESIAYNAASGMYYITERFGNTLYKMSVGGSVQKVSIDGLPFTTTSSATTPDPYRVAMSPDGSKYFISCEHSNELRVFNAQTDQLIKTIPVGHVPQEIAVSASQPYVFVTCMNDTLNSSYVGSVYAINYNTYEAKRIEGKFFQPYGIAVDDHNGVFYVFSRNQDKKGPLPHHASPCNGRNGYYTVYSTSTLLPVNDKRYEISVDPYSADTRFK